MFEKFKHLNSAHCYGGLNNKIWFDLQTLKVILVSTTVCLVWLFLFRELKLASKSQTYKEGLGISDFITVFATASWCNELNMLGKETALLAKVKIMS